MAKEFKSNNHFHSISSYKFRLHVLNRSMDGGFSWLVASPKLCRCSREVSLETPPPALSLPFGSFTGLIACHSVLMKPGMKIKEVIYKKREQNRTMTFDFVRFGSEIELTKKIMCSIKISFDFVGSDTPGFRTDETNF